MEILGQTRTSPEIRRFSKSLRNKMRWESFMLNYLDKSVEYEGKGFGKIQTIKGSTEYDFNKVSYMFVSPAEDDERLSILLKGKKDQDLFTIFQEEVLDLVNDFDLSWELTPKDKKLARAEGVQLRNHYFTSISNVQWSCQKSFRGKDFTLHGYSTPNDNRLYVEAKEEGEKILTATMASECLNFLLFCFLPHFMKKFEEKR